MIVHWLTVLPWGDGSWLGSCIAQPLSHYAYTTDLFSQHIAYAKGKSDAVAKEDGTYKPRMKKQPEEGVL